MAYIEDLIRMQQAGRIAPSGVINPGTSLAKQSALSNVLFNRQMSRDIRDQMPGVDNVQPGLGTLGLDEQRAQQRQELSNVGLNQQMEKADNLINQRVQRDAEAIIQGNPATRKRIYGTLNDSEAVGTPELAYAKMVDAAVKAMAGRSPSPRMRDTARNIPPREGQPLFGASALALPRTDQQPRPASLSSAIEAASQQGRQAGPDPDAVFEDGGFGNVTDILRRAAETAAGAIPPGVLEVLEALRDQQGQQGQQKDQPDQRQQVPAVRRQDIPVPEVGAPISDDLGPLGLRPEELAALPPQQKKAAKKDLKDAAAAAGVPDAADEKSGEIPDWALPLTAMGLTMMASPSPNFLQAVGQGGLAALQTQQSIQAGRAKQFSNQSQRIIANAQMTSAKAAAAKAIRGDLSKEGKTARDAYSLYLDQGMDPEAALSRSLKAAGLDPEHEQAQDLMKTILSEQIKILTLIPGSQLPSADVQAEIINRATEAMRQAGLKNADKVAREAMKGEGETPQGGAKYDPRKGLYTK